MFRCVLGLFMCGVVSLASGQTLKPKYVACDSARDLTRYTSAVAANNKAELARLWESSCGSTTPLAGVARVRVLEAGPLMSKIRISVGGDVIEVWTYPEAIAK